jgi:hypothetical protein
MRSGFTDPSTYVLVAVAIVLAVGLSLLWRFVSVRVLASLALPLLAGWLVTLVYAD